jgi:hypothetical protein
MEAADWSAGMKGIGMTSYNGLGPFHIIMQNIVRMVCHSYNTSNPNGSVISDTSIVLMGTSLMLAVW